MGNFLNGKLDALPLWNDDDDAEQVERCNRENLLN
jgi:hypothetical protein